MKKKKNTEFYLLRKKSLSEADLFVWKCAFASVK